jgi:sporulation protein YlmC with PRC-barrel domain
MHKLISPLKLLDKSRILASFGALLIMLAGTAFAAQELSLQDRGEAEGQRPTSEPRLSAQGVHKVSRLLGKAVKNPQGETLGKLNELVIDEQGQVKYFVLAHSGVLSMGTKKTAIAWKLLQFSPKGSPYLVGISKKQLVGLPIFSEDEWPTEAQVTEFSAHKAQEGKTLVAPAGQ